MKLINLNVWAGKLKEKLLPFLTSVSKEVDVLCLQEVPNVDESKIDRAELERLNRVLNAYAENENARDMTLYKTIKNVLPKFHSYLTEPYGDGQERLATFVSKRNRMEENTVFEMHPTIVANVEGRPYNFNSFLQLTRFSTGGRAYSVCNTHGIWQGGGKGDTPERLKQSKNMVEFLEKLRGKKILCGDLNLSPDTRSIKLIEDAGMRNLVREFGVTSTRSGFTPQKKGRYADYIFVSKDVDVADFRVINEAVSDHLPLYLEFS